MTTMPHTKHDAAHDTFAKRVLERIEGEGVHPRPRWTFVLRNALFWGTGALAIVLGAIACSAIIFDLSSADWRFATVTHGSLWSFAISVMPVLWIVTLSLFVGIGYLNIRHTKHGYRYPLTVIALGAVLTSFSLGAAFHLAGLGERVEHLVGDHPPFYHSPSSQEQGWWTAPGQGLLSGTVVGIATTSNATFMLRDFTGKTWTVDGRDLQKIDFSVIARGGAVRVAGVPTTATSTVFHACFAFPWPSRTNAPLPPEVLAGIAAMDERNTPPVRSDACKGIRPYQELRTLDQAGI